MSPVANSNSPSPKDNTRGTFLDHIADLDIKSSPPYVRLTGVVCTIGPACKDPAILERMIDSGMNIARLNFSHGTHDYHAESIRNLRVACANYAKKIGRTHNLAIALDTKGSEIRTGVLENGASAEVLLVKGDTITLTTDKNFISKGTKSKIYVDYPQVTKCLKPGSEIFIDDGLIQLICAEVRIDSIICKIESGGLLGSSKGVNLPGVEKNLPTITEKDRNDLKFGVEQGIDMVFASFTRNAQEVREIRQLLANSKIKVIAKIENQAGVDHMDEIIDEADGILIDRGDLGMEISYKKVFLAQKLIIAKCNKVGKPIVIATQFMDSMIDKPRPTRAESSDVANAVLDGADCVMLAGETAKGAYPIECVQTMASICREAEAAVWQQQVFSDLTDSIVPPVNAAQTVAISAVDASVNCQAAAIIVVTKTGKSAQLISKYKPTCPIIAVTRNAQVARQLHLYRAIMPVHFADEITGDWVNNVNTRVQAGIDYGKALGFIKSKNWVVLVTGWKQGAGFTNTMSLMHVQ